MGYILTDHTKNVVVCKKERFKRIKRTVNDLGVIVEKDKALMIRKITPRESLRLMGWTDERIELIINNFFRCKIIYICR